MRRADLRRTLVAVMVLCLAQTLIAGVDPRTPTQDGLQYGTADGQALTMDYYAAKGSGKHPLRSSSMGADITAVIARAGAKHMSRIF